MTRSSPSEEPHSCSLIISWSLRIAVGLSLSSFSNYIHKYKITSKTNVHFLKNTQQLLILSDLTSDHLTVQLIKFTQKHMNCFDCLESIFWNLLFWWFCQANEGWNQSIVNCSHNWKITWMLNQMWKGIRNFNQNFVFLWFSHHQQRFYDSSRHLVVNDNITYQLTAESSTFGWCF